MVPRRLLLLLLRLLLLLLLLRLLLRLLLVAVLVLALVLLLVTVQWLVVPALQVCRRPLSCRWLLTAQAAATTTVVDQQHRHTCGYSSCHRSDEGEGQPARGSVFDRLVTAVGRTSSPLSPTQSSRSRTHYSPRADRGCLCVFLSIPVLCHIDGHV